MEAFLAMNSSSSSSSSSSPAKKAMKFVRDVLAAAGPKIAVPILVVGVFRQKMKNKRKEKVQEEQEQTADGYNDIKRSGGVIVNCEKENSENLYECSVLSVNDDDGDGISTSKKSESSRADCDIDLEKGAAGGNGIDEQIEEKAGWNLMNIWKKAKHWKMRRDVDASRIEKQKKQKNENMKVSLVHTEDCPYHPKNIKHSAGRMHRRQYHGKKKQHVDPPRRPRESALNMKKSEQKKKLICPVITTHMEEMSISVDSHTHCLD